MPKKRQSPTEILKQDTPVAPETEADVTTDAVEPEDVNAGETGEVMEEPTQAAEEPQEAVEEKAVEEEEEKSFTVNEKKTKKKSKKKAEAEPSDQEGDAETLLEATEKALNELAENNFKRRKINRASIEEKRAMYTEDEMIFSDYDVVAKTETSILQEEYDFYCRAALSNPTMILKGIIDGVRETQNGMLIASVGNVVAATKSKEKAPGNFYQVFIPVNQLFVFRKEDYKNEDALKTLKNKMVARIGSKISFCVFQVEEKARIVFGSALMANHIRVQHFYVKPQKGSTLPGIYPGLKAVAEINEVHLGRIHVDIGGAEATLEKKDISYNHLGPLTDIYKNGDTITVMINDVTLFDYQAGSQKYQLAKVSCSAKEAKKKPADLYFDEFQVGGIYGGTIEAEKDKTHVYVMLKGKMDCVCKIPASRRAAIKETCSVVITYRDEEKKRLFGEIIMI